MTKKDVAIIGGTFDPVHNGHIAMAKYLSDNYIVDEIWILPSYNSPHKDIDTINSFNDRVNMLKIATRDIKNVKLLLFEKEYYEKFNNINTNLKTYTSDILKELTKIYLNVRFHIVVGFDSIKQISTWHDYEYLIKNFWFYIFDRKDDEFITYEQKKMYLDNLGVKHKKKFIYEILDTNIPDISSSRIRLLLKDKIKNKKELLDSIDTKVLHYIITHKLYL